MALTESQAKKAKPTTKKYQLSDDDGLSLFVEPGGNKYWGYRYQDQDGKRKLKRLGNYPEFSLSEARSKRDNFKIQLVENPQDKHAGILFKNVAKEWLKFKEKSSFGDKPRGGVLTLAERCLEVDINPIIGDSKFSDIKRFDLVQVVREIENRGVKEPVKKACSYLNQIYDYAVAVGYTDFNIAVNLNKTIASTKIKINYPHLKGGDVHDFVNRIKTTKGNPIIKKALWLKLYSGVRGAEVISAKPEHFDLEKGLWRIPAINVKQFRRKALRGFDVPDYVIPLSLQAIEVVRSALEWSHGERYVFSSPKKVGQHIHFNSINLLIRNMGYDKDQLSSHGLRSTMSTVLNNSGLFKSEWIEAQLSHTDKNETRGAYNHAEYIEHRAKMMQWWGDYLHNVIV